MGTKVPTISDRLSGVQRQLLDVLAGQLRCGVPARWRQHTTADEPVDGNLDAIR